MTRGAANTARLAEGLVEHPADSKKAAVAVAASVPRRAFSSLASLRSRPSLTAAYFILLRGGPYQESPPPLYVQPNRQKTANRLIRKLQDLGLRVEVKSAA